MHPTLRTIYGVGSDAATDTRKQNEKRDGLEYLHRAHVMPNVRSHWRPASDVLYANMTGIPPSTALSGLHRHHHLCETNVHLWYANPKNHCPSLAR